MPKGKKKKFQRPRRVMRGRGGLWEDIQKGYSRAKDWSRSGLGRYAMEAANTALDRFHPGVGGAFRGARKVLGWGAYSTSPHKLLASPIPNMHSVGENGVRISHHEFLGDISSSTTFTNTRFTINPGIATTFPWLSGVARNFQKYEFTGLCFYFKSTSAVALNSTNTALGTLIGATQYNDYEVAPINKTSMLNISGAIDGRPAEDNMYPVECDASHRMFKNLLVRAAAVSDDYQKYDIANFNLATVGSQAVAVIGELHVCYDVILKQPIPAQSFSNGPLCACYSSTSGIDATHEMGTSVTEIYNYVGVRAASVDYRSWEIPAGTGGAWQIVYYTQGTAGAITPVNITLTNATGISALASGVGTLAAPATGETAGKMVTIRTFAVTNPQLPITFTFGSGTFPTNPTLATFTIIQLNGALSPYGWAKSVTETKEQALSINTLPPSPHIEIEDEEDETDTRVVPDFKMVCSRRIGMAPRKIG